MIIITVSIIGMISLILFVSGVKKNSKKRLILAYSIILLCFILAVGISYFVSHFIIQF